MIILKTSQFKLVRKKILQTLKIPKFFTNNSHPQNQNDVSKQKTQKKLFVDFFGLRLLDSDPEVRCEAFRKLRIFKILISDFDCPHKRMLIIKEGLEDKDQNVVQACINFLEPTLLSF